ncbi:MAG: DUF3052 domain-containing protein [Candidatus Latescibacterota bacterium]|nr:DUF3052 domain-containing protein [Candidatus Latescibacterota bacterium]
MAKSAEYSRRSLADKLGIKSGDTVAIQRAPEGYDETLGILSKVTMAPQLSVGSCDFVQLFSDNKSKLEKGFPAVKKAIKKDGMLWISWPKKASGMQTDLTEGFIRKIGLKAGLVDVKVADVDEVWSGLKFVYGKEDR